MSRSDLDLTRRQFDVMALVIAGKSNAEIAEELDIATATVKSHLTEIFYKLGVSNRTAAARVAVDKHPMLRALLAS